MKLSGVNACFQCLRKAVARSKELLQFFSGGNQPPHDFPHLADSALLSFQHFLILQAQMSYQLADEGVVSCVEAVSRLKRTPLTPLCLQRETRSRPWACWFLQGRPQMGTPQDRTHYWTHSIGSARCLRLAAYIASVPSKSSRYRHSRLRAGEGELWRLL